MDVHTYQQQIAETMNAYGRPPTPSAHLRKLGEEIGELAEAVSHGQHENIIAECADVVNVVISLLDQVGGSLDVALSAKIQVLNERMREGRFDKRFGKQPTKYGV